MVGGQNGLIGAHAVLPVAMVHKREGVHVTTHHHSLVERTV